MPPRPHRDTLSTSTCSSGLHVSWLANQPRRIHHGALHSLSRLGRMAHLHPLLDAWSPATSTHGRTPVGLHVCAAWQPHRHPRHRDPMPPRGYERPRPHHRHGGAGPRLRSTREGHLRPASMILPLCVAFPLRILAHTCHGQAPAKVANPPSPSNSRHPHSRDSTNNTRWSSGGQLRSLDSCT
jgi:hypothetical protein